MAAAASASAADKFHIGVVGPSSFLKMLWALDQSVVERRLEEQASAIGVPVDLLLERLAKLVPGFVNGVRG